MAAQRVSVAETAVAAEFERSIRMKDAAAGRPIAGFWGPPVRVRPETTARAGPQQTGSDPTS